MRTKAVKKIALTRGKVALVNDTDYDYLNQWHWCTYKGRTTYYAKRNVGIGKYKRRTERMHRLILGLQPGDKWLTDHKDGDGLNNQRSNLRACTAMQNAQSQRKRESATSRYRGVYWHHRAHKWCSRIRVNKILIYLGLFNSEDQAAQTYDIAALKHHGRFAMTNKMLGLL